PRASCSTASPPWAPTASRSPTPTRPTSWASPPSCRTSAACRSPTSTTDSSSTVRCRPPIPRLWPPACCPNPIMTDQPETTGKVIRLNVGGKEGKLTTPVGSHIPVRVFERGGDFLMLVLMLDDGEELAHDALEPLVLEYVSVRGMVRFEGQAVLQERDLVRFEVSTAPEVTQRREFVRVPAVQNVVLDDDTSSVRIDG